MLNVYITLADCQPLLINLYVVLHHLLYIWMRVLYGLFHSAKTEYYAGGASWWRLFCFFIADNIFSFNFMMSSLDMRH